MYTRILLLVFSRPFIFSFFFLSVFQTLKCFVILFSGTMRPRRLKPCTHVDSGKMYRVYRNQAAAAAYLSLYFFIFLSLQFSNIKIFSVTVRPRRLKLGTHVPVDKCIVYTGIRLLPHIRLFISSFFFLFNFQTLKLFVTLFSGTVRPRRLKLGTQADSGWMYRVYRNQAAAAFSSLYFFFYLSNFQTLIFCHTFLRNCEA